MQRFLAPFRKLGWKLTFSYTFTTVAALLVAEVAVVVIGLAYVLNSDTLPRITAGAASTAAQSLKPYLEQQPPDISGLENWLMQVAVSGYSIPDEKGNDVYFQPAVVSQGNNQMLILDSQEHLLAAAPEGEVAGVNFSGDRRLPTELEILLQRVGKGERDPMKLYQISSDKYMYMVAPILGDDQRVLGLFVYHGTIFPETNPFEEVLPLLASSTLVFTIAAGAVGTIFGFFTARGLSHRLRRVSDAADAWSRGDFSVFIKDRSGDELGQLATRLDEMAEQLRNLLHTHEQLASLEERNRLARDLHDSVKQQVFAATMQVGAARELVDANPEAAKVRLAEAENLSRQAQQELTALIRQLRPAALGDKGLVKALREYMVDWAQQNGIPAELRAQGERTLPLASEQALFRFIQEALSNVARHSRAQSVQLHLAFEEKRVVLTLIDDGVGFDPANAGSQGVGLNSMRERIEALQGQLQIESGPAGTRLAATIPL